MNIEIVEAYQLFNPQNKHIGWSVHVYLIDKNLDYRGIFVRKTPKGPFIELPFRVSIDPDTNLPVKFPILEFTDPKEKSEFLPLFRKKLLDLLSSKDLKKMQMQERKMRR